MQNLRNKNIPMYCLISGVRATYLYGNTNRIKIIDMMETLILYKVTMDKSVLVEGERERERNKIPQQRITDELERKMDGKRMQDLYIRLHNMVSMEYIFWLRELKMNEKKEQREMLN